MVAECCMKGFKWDGTPVGTEGMLGKNKAYITGTNDEVAVLLIHDIYGWKLPNIRLLADHFAQEADCTVYVADFYEGEVLPTSLLESTFRGDITELGKLDLRGFLTRHGKPIRQPSIFACAQALKLQYQKVGAVGYCWGAWGCFQLGARGQNLLDCVAVAHPSHLEHGEIDALAVPTLILAPEHDVMFKPELKEYCNRVIPGLGVEYRYDHYPGLAHGFACKGDVDDPVQRAGLERAKDAIVGWLNTFLH